MTIPTISIIGMIFSTIISIGLPITLLILVWKKKKGTFLAAGLGAAGFVVFVSLLERALHSVVLSVFPNFQSNVWLYILYICLITGIFEETSRVVGFIILKKWQHSKKIHYSSSLMYGIGHSGIESLLGVGLVSLSNLMVVFSVNAQGIDAFVANAGDQAEILRTQLIGMAEEASMTYYWVGIERIFTTFLHIALSVLIWMVMTKRIHFLWYPGAILIHAVVNLPARLYQAELLNTLWVVEVLSALLMTAVVILVWQMHKRCKQRRAIEKQKHLEQMEALSPEEREAVQKDAKKKKEEPFLKDAEFFKE